MRRRTAATSLIAALTLAACQGQPDEPTDPDDPPPATQAPTEDEAAGDETVAPPGDEGDATSPEEDDATEDDGTDDEATEDEATEDDGTEDGGTEDGEAPPEDGDAGAAVPWVDPGEQVEQPPADGAYDAGQEIVDVRVGAHDGFDRVVLDLSGDEATGQAPLLGWFGLYEDAAHEAGSGAPIEVAGSAVLSVPVNGIDWLTESDERYDGSTVAGGGTTVVTEVVFGVLNEGQQQVFLGVQERTPYRIFALSDPARIVIDVQHP